MTLIQNNTPSNMFVLESGSGMTTKKYLLLKKNNIDESHYLLNLKGNFQIKNNEVHNMTLDSSFLNILYVLFKET